LSRLVNPDGIGTQRARLMKAVGLALRKLAGRTVVDDESRDLAAFIVLALREINETVDTACQAWERRDYWLKADQFRRDWAWASLNADKLERLVLEGRWQDLALAVPDLVVHLNKVTLPKRNTLGTPWLGAYAQLREMRGMEKEWVVKR